MFANHIHIKVKRLDKDAHPLRRGTSGAAGTDVAYLGDKDIVLYPGETIKISTGWAFELPSNVGMLIIPRSGMACKNKVRPMNTPGLLDSDYRGELIIALEHFGRFGKDDSVTIKPGDYVAQLMLVPFYKPMFNITDTLSETKRGSGGFGSTDQPNVG